METIHSVKDPGWQMIVPLMLFSAAIVTFGVYSEPLRDFIFIVVNGL